MAAGFADNEFVLSLEEMAAVMYLCSKLRHKL